MRLNLLKNLCFLLVAQAICFSSCNKNVEEPKDIVSPEIKFTTIEEGITVRGQVSLDLNASDNKGVTRIEIYIGNTLITTLTEAPYTYKWNTKEYTDGTYTVKAVVYDKEGNTKETVINLNVLNRLLKIIVPPTALVAPADDMTIEGWIFLSDSKGQTLGVKRFNNEDIIEFISPDNFDEEKVHVNILKVLKNVNVPDSEIDRTHYNIVTYEIAVSEVMILTTTYRSVTREEVGRSSYKLNNLPNDDINYYLQLSFEDEAVRVNNYNVDAERNASGDFVFYKTPLKGLVIVNSYDERIPKYKIYENLKINEHYEDDYGSFLPMNTSMDLEYPDAQDHMTLLYGFRKTDEISSKYFLGWSFMKYVKLYYPENYFDQFSTYTTYYDGTNKYWALQIGDIMRSVPKIDMSCLLLSSKKDSYSFTTDGVFDTYNLNYKYYVQSDPKYKYLFDWNIYGPKNASVTGVVPIIPVEITDNYKNLVRDFLEFSSLNFTDYVDIESEEYFDAILNGKKNPGNKGFTSISYYKSSSNGRKAFSKELDLKRIQNSMADPNSVLMNF